MESTACFIIPFFSNGLNNERNYLSETVTAIFKQTDDNWHIIIIDDASIEHGTKEFLTKMKELEPNKIDIILKNENLGQGVCRNDGIELARKKGFPYILFNDADDISNPNRVKLVREVFSRNSDVMVIYSSFIVIDEHSIPTSKNDLAPSILEILETHKDVPFTREDYWIDMATTIGYTNLTSSTAVRIEIAFNNPFPEDRVAEDYHTWVRYSASGGFFYYTPSIPSLYRIPKNSDGSSSRTRAGGRTLFNKERAKVEEAGMYKAIDIYRKRKTLCDIEIKKILMYFYFRLYKSFFAEGDYELADSQHKKACSLLKDICPSE